MIPTTTECFLPPAARTVPEILRRQARRFGDKPFLTMPGAQWRHADLERVASERGGALKAAGVAQGDRVAIMCGNRGELLETVLGCAWIGAIAVPMNTASMGPQIEYQLADCAAALLVIDDQYAGRLETVDLRRTALQQLWLVSAAAAAEPRTFGALRVQRWPLAGPATEAASVRPSDPFVVLYTSGTTGPSKGVLCPHAHLYWWGANTADALGLREDDVLCTTLPLFHINALHTFVQAALVGCKVTYLEKFSASGFWPAMTATGATVIYLLGAMVPLLLAQPARPAEREHKVRTGQGPGVPQWAGEAFLERTGVLLLEGYGATETNLVIAAAPNSPRRGIMGWLRPGFDARVVDEADNELPDGQAGELVLRAGEPFAFASGYLGQPEKTVEAWRNLWFHTGDRVVRDADGAFRFVDRIKDAIRRRGENVSSWEVEQVILAHSAVAACAVYPVRSDLGEDEVMAAVVPRENASLDPAELAAFCASRLQKFAIPRFIDVVADLPRTDTGKLQKYKLRERGVTSTCWDRDPRRP